MKMETSRHSARLSTACNVCRRRKRRCDGFQPCSLCRSKGLECSYSPQLDRRRPPSARLVESLRKRIEVLENNAANNIPSSRTESVDGLKIRSFAPGRLFFGLTFGDNGEIEYRGPTSSLPEPKLEGSDNATISSFHPRTSERPTYDPHNDQSEWFQLPSLEVMQSLLDIFLEWQNSSILILPGSLIEVILQEYSVEEPTQSRRMLLLAIISLTRRMLARPGEDPEIARAESDICFNEAKSLMLETAFSSPVLETVQTACILACREYGHGRENSAWLMNGITATTGSILGLHVGRDYARWVAAGYFSPAVVEGRIIAHWASVMIDRMLACCLGRHGLIHPDDFNTPPIPVRLPMTIGSLRNSRLPILTEGSSIYEDSVSSTFHYAVELWGLSDRSLTEIYDFQHDLSDMKDYYANQTNFSAKVAKHRLKVLEWHHKLPSAIQLQKSQPLPHILSLHMLFNSLLILMHRPFLGFQGPPKTHHPSTSSSTSTAIKDTPEQSLFATSAAVCTSSAFEITNLIRSYKAHYTLGVIPFVVVHYLVNASTIHIVNSESEDPQLAASAAKAYESCIRALEEIAKVLDVARKSIALLGKLRGECREWVVRGRERGLQEVLEGEQGQIGEITFESVSPNQGDFYASDELGNLAQANFAVDQFDFNPEFWINFNGLL